MKLILLVASFDAPASKTNPYADQPIQPPTLRDLWRRQQMDRSNLNGMGWERYECILLADDQLQRVWWNGQELLEKVHHVLHDRFIPSKCHARHTVN